MFLKIMMKLVTIVFVLGLNSNVSAQKSTFHTAKAPQPQPSSMFISPERIKLKNGGFYNAERATMFVPLNRSVENGDVISLDVYRFKASEKADPSTPPIFFLHGGPSFRGLEGQLNILGNFEKYWQFMLDTVDVVVVSQRGIGPSKPTTIVEITTAATPPDEQNNDNKNIADLQNILTSERGEWEKLGLDLQGFTVLEAAEDLNDVRQAFGYDKITIWGGSFGSHWAMALMRTHPEIIERAILRGMEGPDHTYDHPGHAWNVYKRMAEDAESSNELKGLIPEGGLINAAETIVSRLKSNPFSIDVKSADGSVQNILFDGTTAQLLTRGYSGNLAAWPADIITMYEGNFEPAARLILRRYKNQTPQFTTASYFMLDCGSGITPERLEEHLTDPASETIGTISWGYINSCPVWDSDLGDGFRQNFDVEIPTVIVHGTWDRSTPYENGLELAPFFKNSKFIPLKRGPHGAIREALNKIDGFKEKLLHFAGTGDMSQLPNQMELPEPEWVVPN